MEKPKESIFIVVEGPDGSGKSTLVQHAKENLPILTTFEPGDSLPGKDIRRIALEQNYSGSLTPETQMCLMFADRFVHLEEVIKPRLDTGHSVISDRFAGSTFAYQLYGQGAGYRLTKLFWVLYDTLTIKPDYYIYIDVSLDELVKRKKLRKVTSGKEDHFDERDIDFLKKLKEGYDVFHSKHPICDKVIKIDGNPPLEEVKKEFLKVVSELLDKRLDKE